MLNNSSKPVKTIDINYQVPYSVLSRKASFSSKSCVSLKVSIIMNETSGLLHLPEITGNDSYFRLIFDILQPLYLTGPRMQYNVTRWVSEIEYMPRDRLPISSVGSCDQNCSFIHFSESEKAGELENSSWNMNGKCHFILCIQLSIVLNRWIS